MVIRGRQQVAVEVWVPGEAVALLLVPPQLQVGVTFPTGIRLARVLGVVEHQHVRAGGLGGNDAGVLGHVPGPVHLTLVVDLYLYLDLARHGAEPSELSLLIIWKKELNSLLQETGWLTVVRGVKLSVLVGQLDAGNEKVVLLVAGVGAQYEPVDTVVLPLRPGHVRQPLGRQAGPLQGVGHHQVVQEGRVLLPYLVLLVDDSLLHRLVEGVSAFLISHCSEIVVYLLCG